MSPYFMEYKFEEKYHKSLYQNHGPSSWSHQTASLPKTTFWPFTQLRNRYIWPTNFGGCMIRSRSVSDRWNRSNPVKLVKCVRTIRNYVEFRTLNQLRNMLNYIISKGI